MDSELVAVGARHLERLMIVVAGALSIVLGYRMFLAIPRAADAAETGEGKLELPGGISIYVTRVGPGVFFALFGAVILALGLHHGLKVDVKEQRPMTATSGEPATGAMVVERRLSSAVQSGASDQQREAERANALGTVAQLGRLAAALDGPGGRSLSQQQRLDYGLALADARSRILTSAWDERVWGSHAEFARWLQDGMGGDPPSKAAAAARAYRGER